MTTRAGTGWTQNFGYDALNRLTSSTEGTNWSETSTYDRYGNRWLNRTGSVMTSNPALTPVASGWINASNNQLNFGGSPGAYYDARGNQTFFDQGRTLAYDGEDHVKSANGPGSSAAYEYDGAGRRVRRLTCTVAGPCTAGTSGAKVTTYVYDAMGQLALESATNTTPVSGETWPQYLTADHLGSTRLITKSDGTAVKCYDYLPFGEEIPSGVGARAAQPCFGAASANTLDFTGKERDAETGLDYFGARYMSSAQGRFTSPDEWAGGIVDAYSGGQVGAPSPLPYADITDPQTINKYVYVRNNPLRYVDPDGHCPWCIAAVVGAGLDLATQTLVEGKSLSDVDYGSVLLSGATSAIGAGIGAKIASFGWKAKIAVELATDAASSSANQLYSSGKVDAASVAIDVVAGQAAGAIAGRVAAKAGSSDTVKGLVREAERKERIAANATSAASAARRTAQAEQLRGAASGYIERRAAAVGVAASGIASTTVKKVKEKVEDGQ